jgi:TIR domain-containing protein
MPSSQPCRVFISYARKDGSTLAQRLQSDLVKQGFDAWLDTKRLRGGASWTQDIEIALDEAKYALAVMTPGSYVSHICRAEQLRALRKGKCVIPIKAQSNTDIPLHLEAKNYRDFSDTRSYDEGFRQLLQDLSASKGVELREEFRDTYVTAPPLPVNFVERPEELAALRNALISDDGGRHIALTALHGMGGIGKNSACPGDLSRRSCAAGVSGWDHLDHDWQRVLIRRSNTHARSWHSPWRRSVPVRPRIGSEKPVPHNH